MPDKLEPTRPALTAPQNPVKSERRRPRTKKRHPPRRTETGIVFHLELVSILRGMAATFGLSLGEFLDLLTTRALRGRDPEEELRLITEPSEVARLILSPLPRRREPRVDGVEAAAGKMREDGERKRR